jgi:phenylalanine ammonia-lyase
MIGTNSLLDAAITSGDSLQAYRRHATSAPSKSSAATHGLTIDGSSLTVAGLVASARYRATPSLSKEKHVVERVEDAVLSLQKRLKSGDSLYGINTGFGGSADSRTSNMHALQLALLQHQQCGVLPVPPSFPVMTPSRPGSSLPLSTHQLSQPEAWVRGAMVVRLNSLARGHSGVRYMVLERMQKFIEENIVPVVPLKSSISASGDLSPLSYVAGAIGGQEGIYVWVDGPDGSRVMMSSDKALRSKGIPATVYEPKEALGILNGTAFATSAASLAIYDASMLCLLTQITTAMAVEASGGTDGSFASFIHEVCRPHPGQIETASTILSLLDGSKLAAHHAEEEIVHMDADIGSLRQDRYPLRTAAQWIGPQVEDIMQSWKTIETELNSTTDNPLIEVHEDHGSTIHHGGNFQAMAISNTMEKTRLSLQHFGKLTFAQMTELINPAMNRGLPANLAATDPSLNFHAKGVDIALAAVTAELGYLANPVTTHVQSAEMGNQAVNSMALVSARYTVEAIETLSLLMSWSLYLLCQAFDLRALQKKTSCQVEKAIIKSIQRFFSTWIDEANQIILAKKVFARLNKRMDETSARDLEARLQDSFMHAGFVLVEYFSKLPGKGTDPLKTIVGESNLVLMIEHH